MIPLSERDILKANHIVSQETESNNFAAVLDKGKIFRIEGLQPVYFYDELRGALLVTSREHLDKKFH